MTWREFVAKVEAELEAAGLSDEQIQRATIDTIRIGNLAALSGIFHVDVDFSDEDVDVSIYP